MSKKLKIFTDGGSRSNPGPSFTLFTPHRASALWRSSHGDSLSPQAGGMLPPDPSLGPGLF